MDLWHKFLWKDREDPIRPMSSMTFEGGTDMSIYEKYQPFFWGLFAQDRLIGCNSTHQTGPTEMRSRGLYIHPEHRLRGGTKLLFNAAENHAVELGVTSLWSYPKKEVLAVYQKSGFHFIRDSLQSPNHCYVRKTLSLSE